MNSTKGDSGIFMDKKSIPSNNFDILPYVVAVVVGFILFALFIVWRKRSSTRRNFLLMGLSGCGKSSVFMSVLYNKFPETVISLMENIGTYKSGGLSCTLIDIPGHYRVGNKCFDNYKRTAKGIIFVVDSVTIQRDLRDVADVLYNALTDRAVLPCSILVLCNKQDLATAKSAQVIKDLVEKEMNTIRDSRSRTLKTVGVEDVNQKSVFLGKPDMAFEWSHIPQNIQFYECSAKDRQLNHLTDWLDRML